MTTQYKLGWQQVEILRRCYLKEGMTSGQLLQGLNQHNSPQKRLQSYGLIEDRSTEDRVRAWFITPEGLAQLKRRDPVLVRGEVEE